MALDKTIHLKDGRTLPFAEYGDPLGRSVFFFHCIRVSRLSCPSPKVTRKAGVRLIIPDRPGSGLSDFQPGRRILDWPKDITQLADHLGIGKFAVAVHSGGGPYVAACTYGLPDRFTTAAMLSGAGPIDSPQGTLGMSSVNKFGIKVGRFIPWLIWQALISVFYYRRARNPAADMERGDGIRPPADDEQIHKPEVWEACLRSEVEAFRPGLRGLSWDAHLLARPWGFPLENIRVPIHLWNGTEDDQVPISMARFIAGKIPGSKITICENEAHLALFPHWEEILTQLISE